MRNSEGGLPEWFRIKHYDRKKYLKTLKRLQKEKLNTICIEADCPNRYECFSGGTATFLILGNTCTRHCLYCNVRSGIPERIDPSEPERIAIAVKSMGLKYAVITSVTRDDLEDGGASQFAATIRAIRKYSPNCKIEVLIPDLKGDFESLRIITRENPDVVSHNIEVSENLFRRMRPGANFNRSLQLLRKVRELNPKIKVKSGFMLGLGERKRDIIAIMKKLRDSGCQILTIGQYLRPSRANAPVRRYYTPREFESLRRAAISMGFEAVASGPLVRSSYRADEYYPSESARNVRVIFDTPRDAFLNMAIDEALLQECSFKRAMPTLRLYSWNPPAVSIGFFQRIREEVDLKRAKSLGVDVVRRYTGGGAVFHEMELTYSIVIPEDWAPGSITSSYRKICSGIVRGLSLLGLRAEFSPINDILVNGRKISGNAQTRRNGFILQHGTILIGLDAEKMFSLLKVPSEKLRGKMLNEAMGRVTCLEWELGRKPSLKEVREAIKIGFSEALKFQPVRDGLTQSELKLAEGLASRKYRTKRWNFLR